MKGNDGTGNIENRDDWETPQWLFDLLDKQYAFEMDWCASEENTKCILYTNNIFKTSVLPETICWMNPPFSKATEIFTEFFKRTPKGVAIYRCDNMETKVWQEIIFPNASWVFIPKGRVAYCYNEDLRGGKGCRFPSALIGFNVPPINKGSIKGVNLIIKEVYHDDY